jgi:hypothetical protein
MTPGQRSVCLSVCLSGWMDGWMEWSWVTALCALTRGKPSSAHCEQRLSDGSPLARANLGGAMVSSRAAAESGWPDSADCEQKLSPGHPLPSANRGAPTAKTEEWSSSDPVSRRRTYTLCSAALRAVTGWRGGLGRVGADLVSAARMRPPPSPVFPTLHRQHSAARPTHVSRETLAWST